MSHNPDITPPAGAHTPPGAVGPTVPDPAIYPPPPPGPFPSDQVATGQLNTGQPGTGQPGWTGQPVPPAPSVPGRQPQPREEERTVAVLAHLSPIVAAILSVGWLTILGPLVIWAIYRDRSPLVRQAAAGAFNFNLGIWAAAIVGWVCFFTIVLIPVALVLWLVAAVVGLVCHIQGAVKASRGEPYRYPFTIPILS